ncbi:hypothetical protein HYC85_012081 [Camellia sinensis]|uniref:Uncharacterized protein n=1 Tax=Camellia sinensis TaxID=4442 RepID=A0A7J7HDW6_CAMSI|nr:hypothetical protein HYC85_012081 [Camellia sinensis]
MVVWFVGLFCSVLRIVLLWWSSGGLACWFVLFGLLVCSTGGLLVVWLVGLFCLACRFVLFRRSVAVETWWPASKGERIQRQPIKLLVVTMSMVAAGVERENLLYDCNGPIQDYLSSGTLQHTPKPLAKHHLRRSHKPKTKFFKFFFKNNSLKNKLIKPSIFHIKFYSKITLLLVKYVTSFIFEFIYLNNVHLKIFKNCFIFKKYSLKTKQKKKTQKIKNSIFRKLNLEN